jgi:hypothetical protein
LTANPQSREFETPKQAEHVTMNNHQPLSATSLMIVAGEASGDKHGAKLVAALGALCPDVQLRSSTCGWPSG